MTNIRIELPAAPPGDYLRWMAFWREIEQRMGESPALEELAARESASFVRDDIARYLSDIVTTLVSQAKSAANDDRRDFQPVLDVDVERMTEAAGVFARRIGWLTPDRCRAMGVEPLEPRLADLRARVLETVAARLQEVAGES